MSSLFSDFRKCENRRSSLCDCPKMVLIVGRRAVRMALGNARWLACSPAAQPKNQTESSVHGQVRPARQKCPDLASKLGSSDANLQLVKVEVQVFGVFGSVKR